jgi:hypothetical protein
MRWSMNQSSVNVQHIGVTEHQSVHVRQHQCVVMVRNGRRYEQRICCENHFVETHIMYMARVWFSPPRWITS